MERSRARQAAVIPGKGLLNDGGRTRALRSSDIDVANHSVMVRRNRVRSELKKPKSGKVRSVPLIDQAAVALERLSRRRDFTSPGDLVFCTETGSFIDDGELRLRLCKVVKAAGSGHKRDEIRPPLHDLGRHFGTLGTIEPVHDLQNYMATFYARLVPKPALPMPCRTCGRGPAKEPTRRLRLGAPALAASPPF